MLTLYDYFRSSASFRVRIALNLKKVAYQLQEVHLVSNGGEQHQDDYKDLNPQELVPTLVDGDFHVSQSMAILDYLEAQYPNPSLLFGDAQQQAKIRALANIVACDIHPLDNLRVLQYLKGVLKVSDEEKQTWYAHWIVLGFKAIEVQLDSAGPYCFAEQVTLADVCLIPQVYNACRFNVDMIAFPKIERVYNACMQLDAFAKADPDSQ